ncbi:hypothetical protein F1188_02815 [Roseospira marina]|uniref:Uncharacterized protein n=2 Tax=Roseospira marina TaxID=140057 RepID=A0A5M6IF08_9PROT|nr:hypothetical protein [Roseospira marina]KAA5606864.1 hypothetical protein F1188_02815 [Roseospira marina]MBB4312968.1 hypothetical protein [Roseospira marina]
MPVESLAAALDGMLETEEGAARPLGDPREPDVIRTWVHLTAAVADDALDTAIEQAIAALAVDRPGRARLSAAGLIVGLPVQAALIGGYVRTFRRIKAIAAAGGLDDAAMMAETRRDLRALNQRMAEALGALRDQRAAMGRMNRILVDRERRQAGMNADLARAREDLEAARVVLARVEAERDEARRIADAARAERDTLRGDVKRARAGVEDLKAKYLEKFALSLHDLNQARAMLYNDPTSTLPAMKASVAQGYFMILEDMGAGEVARKLMAGIAKDGL